MAGAAVLVAVGSLYIVALGSAKWAQTEGRVVYAGWINHAQSTQNFKAFGPAYYVRHDVKYEYTVGGQTLSGSRPWFGHSMWGWRWAPRPEQRPRLYTVGQTTTVYYDPAHPERCTLSRNIPGDRFQTALVVAAILLLAGLGAMTGHIAVRG